MPFEALPMRKDLIFNAGGVYELVLEKNICLHKEAAEKVFELTRQHLTKINASKTLQILDLACGGKPFITSTLMQRLSDYQFVYTGVDINKDQIDSCKKYPFSKNVKADAMEGNVWDLEKSALNPPYDIIFMGLNSHHAVPEEIFYAAKTIARFLKPGGLFLNHDLFRPAQYPYLRRPESLGFISKEKLEKANISTPLSPLFAGNGNSPWREEWLTLHKAHLIANGYSLEEANQGIEHMRERDWPISLEEMAEILERAGLKTTIHRYQNTNYPRPEFYGLAAAYKQIKEKNR